MSERIVVIKTTAVGDALMATAHIPELHKQGISTVLFTRPFIAPLWARIPGAVTLTTDQLEGECPIIDLGDYLREQYKYPNDHLVQLQAREIHRQGCPEIDSSPANVGIRLSVEEILEGRRLVDEYSQKKGGLPPVYFAIGASTKNRTLPTKTLQDVVYLLQGEAVCCIERPPEKGDLVQGAENVWKSLRETAAFMAVAPVVVAVDSGPFHLANAALQGSKDVLDELGLNRDHGKVIVALGSTPKTSIVYENNRVVTGEGCDIVCRAVGYGAEPDQLIQIFSIPFYPSGNEGDPSYCQFSDYPESETALCMQSISSEEIAEAVMQALNA